MHAFSQEEMFLEICFNLSRASFKSSPLSFMHSGAVLPVQSKHSSGNGLKC